MKLLEFDLEHLATLSPLQQQYGGYIRELIPACTALYRQPFETLDLSASAPVAQGSERRVYLHPYNEHFLLKVLYRTHADGLKKTEKWHRRFTRCGIYRGFFTEFSECVTVAARLYGQNQTLPIARVAGVTTTSLGMGLIVEKIVDEFGALAPNLRQVVAAHGFTAELRSMLDTFFAALADAHVVYNDVGLSNIAFGRNASGIKGLYLVDGFGSRQLVPVYTWSKKLNRRRLERKYTRMLQKIDSEHARQEVSILAV
ncbi:YrbL family protein [Allopusillimonas ginsengisoli]|uniref:YrbL family protein n=1 Tax=Allopusillimonas ginsengisoli TaxID=453575 RepID=UPI0010C19F89|nr:hypothetical protein D7I39_19600 [Allopusillimonas ginsengisoli]